MDSLTRLVGRFRPRPRDVASAGSFGALATGAAEALIVADGALRIRALNAAAERMFGFSAGEVRGERLERLLSAEPADGGPVSAGPFAVSRSRSEAAERGRVVGRRRDGSRFPAEIGVADVTEGSAPLYVVVVRDRARASWAEAALRESEERFRGAFEASAIGFALVETDGRFRAVNRSLCEMIGYGEPELLGLTFQQITHPEDLRADLALLNHVLAGELDRYHLEKRFIHKHGHVVWIVLAVSLVRDASGAPAYVVAQMTDITGRKAAEQGLARHAAELERSNGELREFAYVASHDLQEPLRTVASYAQLVAERYRGLLDARADRWLGYMVSGVERMQHLIGDLLALAQVRTAEGAFAPTDTAAVVVRTWERLRAQPAGSDAQLTLGALPAVVANAAQLEQLFQNLLGNALKYRRPDAPPRVHVSADRRVRGGSAEWEFTVRDNGIGLDMAYADRIFQIFQRLHRDDDHEGTGIGLAICKRIVERHGGRIWVESAPGEGAMFRFTIPERER
ncbi:MAG TPA: PAS domain S-box protein [Longimicrobiales bacterium]|nr:PAS domain S-box protein [Longimicrobiales bacterium]